VLLPQEITVLTEVLDHLPQLLVPPLLMLVEAVVGQTQTLEVQVVVVVQEVAVEAVGLLPILVLLEQPILVQAGAAVLMRLLVVQVVQE
jgi:hypothetical protein